MKKVVIPVVILLALLVVVQLALIFRDRARIRTEVFTALENEREKPRPPDAPTTDEDVKLRIVSDAPGTPPIEGATVSGSHLKGGIRVVTGADGVAVIPRGALGWLRVTAPRHVGMRTKFEGEEEQTLEMTRVGAARFTVKGVDGKPVEGLRIRLTPTSIKPDMEVPYPKEQASDEGGILQWDELLPDSDIHWTCTSGHPLEPGEGVRAGGSELKMNDEGRWVLHTSGNAFEAKGSFKVGPGEVYKLNLRVRLTGSVRAKIGSGPQATGKVRVQVWNKAEIPSPSGTFKDNQVERALFVDPGAEFAVPNLTSGTKEIRAWWWDEPGRRVFARLSFTLSAGEKRDLGTLTPAPGASVEVLVRVEAPPEILDRIVRPAKVRINFSASAPENDDLSVADNLEVEVDKPFVLAGLHANRMFIHCDSQLTTKPGASAVKFKGPGHLEVPLPPPGRIEIVLKGESEHLVQVNLTFPALAKQNQFDALWIPAGGGPTRHLGGGTPMAGTTSYKLGGFVPQGEGEVWVVSRGELNLYARVLTTVKTEGENLLNIGTLSEGAVIRGRIVDKSGKPYKYPISFQLAGTARGNESFYVAIPNEEGRFTMRSVAPGTRLESTSCKPSIVTAGEAGTETWVDLEVQR